MKRFEFPAKLKENLLGVLFTLAVLMFGAIINYFTWSKDEEMTIGFLLLLLFVVALLYLPFVYFSQFSDWQIREFGFVVNGLTVLIAILLIILSGFISLKGSGTDLQVSLIEAFARTGEELFFRGFVYALVVRILSDRKNLHAQIWAIILSSVAFAVVHTQTFLPGSPDTMFDVFLFALFLAFVRFLSGSILPGIILHLLFNTGDIVTVIFGCILYGLFVLWSYRRDEDSLIISIT